MRYVQSTQVPDDLPFTELRSLLSVFAATPSPPEHQELSEEEMDRLGW